MPLLLALLVVTIGCHAVSPGTESNDAERAEAAAHKLAQLARVATPDFVAGFSADERGEMLAVLVEAGDARGVAHLVHAGVSPRQRISVETNGRRIHLTALNYAMAVQNTGDVPLRLLALGADPDEATDDDLPPLLSAIAAKRYDMVGPLLAHGAKPNQQEAKLGLSALMVAVDDKRNPAKGLKSARQLVAAGADINHQSLTGHTALMYSVMAGNLEAARWLLKQGADGRLESADGDTALMLAERRDLSGSSEMVRLLKSMAQPCPATNSGKNQ